MTVYELNRAPNARRVRMFLAEKGKQQALAWFARLDARLAERPMWQEIASPRLWQGRRSSHRPAPHQHHLQAWHERVSARPSAQA